VDWRGAKSDVEWAHLLLAQRDALLSQAPEDLQAKFVEEVNGKTNTQKPSQAFFFARAPVYFFSSSLCLSRFYCTAFHIFFTC
jgi:hypothetical protein